MKNKFCILCGSKLPIEALYCFKCGNKQPDLTELDELDTNILESCEQKEITNKKTDHSSKAISYIINIAIVAVAIVAIVFAFFPISTTEVPSYMQEDTVAPIYITPIKAISLTLASFEDIGDYEMADLLEEMNSDIEDEFEDEIENVKEAFKGNNEYEDLSNSEKRDFKVLSNKYIYEISRIGLKSESIQPSGLCEEKSVNSDLL